MECAHEVCTCQLGSGEEFCSDACSTNMGDGPYCGCGHAECESSPPVANPPLD